MYQTPRGPAQEPPPTAAGRARPRESTAGKEGMAGLSAAGFVLKHRTVSALGQNTARCIAAPTEA